MPQLNQSAIKQLEAKTEQLADNGDLFQDLLDVIAARADRYDLDESSHSELASLLQDNFSEFYTTLHRYL